MTSGNTHSTAATHIIIMTAKSRLPSSLDAVGVQITRHLSMAIQVSVNTLVNNPDVIKGHKNLQ